MDAHRMALRAIDNVGGTFEEAARWMRDHYLARAWKQRSEPREKAAWVALAWAAHRLLLGRLPREYGVDTEREMAGR